jgi:hypothetical protein
MNRRKFLLGLSSIGLSASYNSISFSLDIQPNYASNTNSVIYLFLSGGPSHIELFNTIPHSTVERKSVIGSVKTNVSGIEIGGLFTNLAQKADKYAIVSNFKHADPNHDSAVHWMITGERTTPNAPPKWPSYGSVASVMYGTNSEPYKLPTYIKVNSIPYDGAAWLGAKYSGYLANGDGIKDLEAQNKDKFAKKLEILKTIERNSPIGDSIRSSKDWVDLREQASEIILGSATEAFKIEKDPEYDKYKDNQLGKDLLTALRLVERGVKFVTINFGGWDMHQNILDGFKQKGPILDKYVSLFIDSTHKRELEHKNMFVMSGDFGRTPKINKDGGRDHWPHIVPLLISNSSYEMGRIIGRCDINADQVDGESFEPEDLKWTILNHLGLNKNNIWISTEHRPMTIIQEHAKNILT